MIFNCMPHPGTDVTVNQHPYPHEFARLITQTNVTATIGRFGYFLQQQEEAIDTMIAKQHFELHEPADLEFNTGKPVIVLCYTLEGKITMHLKGYEDVRYEEGKYHMHYLPAGRHQVQMQSGSCTLLQIELSQRKIKILTEQFPSLAPLLQLAQEFSLEYLRMPEESINRDIIRITKSIKTNQDTGAFRKLSMEKQVIELLRHYIRDLAQNKKYNLTNYHYTEEELDKIRQAAAVMAQEGYRKMTFKQLFEDKFNIPLHKALPGFKLLYNMDIRTAKSKEITALACDLLVQTDHTIEQIAYELDYQNSKSLTHIFKRYKGCTPSEYRQMNRRN